MKRWVKTVLLALAMLPAGMFVPSADAQIAAPVFQFAVFYNINLEIDPGAVMTFSGPVFCNQSIWIGGPNATFSSTVAAVGQVNTTAADTFATSYNAGSSTPFFSLAGQPVSGASALVLPFGTNNMPNTARSIIELQLPPSSYALGTPAAYSTNGQVYLCNAADLYISNSPSGINSTTTGTNTFVYYQDSGMTPSLVPIAPDYYKLKTGSITNYVRTNLTAGIDCVTNVQFAGYSFITNALFYDWREGWSTVAAKGKTVQAVQINIGEFNFWLTNAAQSNNATVYNTLCLAHKGHPIDSMYVYTAVPLTVTTLPAVRVVNGIQLPTLNGTRYGFTLATPFPLYVWGDYNAKDTTGSALGLYGTSTATLHTYPAALMADAITILSDSWNDSVTAKNPSPSSTTVNAAILTGIVPSNPSVSPYYSGGVENFLRLLENWGGTLTYNGSMVAMFPSQYATNIWRTAGSSSSANYYNAPTRHWAFDLNFTKGQNYLPPLTPQVGASTFAPVISMQPQSPTVASGNNVTFNVVASGFQLSYQWSFNATNILGATNSSLTLTNVQPDDAGNYAVQVTNLFGSTLSSNAVLTVLVPPTVTTQPTNVTALAGNTAVFTVAADGTAPFSYQWTFNNTNLEDATNLTLTLTNVTMDEAGTYSVIVTNLAGSVTSSNAVLSIYSSAASTLNGASLDTDNDIRFTVAGVPGFNYAVLASTNMMDWVPLTTNISPFVFIDTNTSGNPQQFYRTLYMP